MLEQNPARDASAEFAVKTRHFGPSIGGTLSAESVITAPEDSAPHFTVSY